MSNLFFENQGTNTYLVYEVQPGDELDTMTLGMLTNNTIPGLAAVTFQQVDTTKYIKFNVTAKVSVAQLFSGPVNKKRLMGVFNGVINAITAAEDYMLDPDMLLLDLERMYSDVSTCETVLICLPVMNSGNDPLDLNRFFKNIIFNTQFDQTENCGYVAQILNYLNSTPNLSLTDFKKLLDSINGSVPAPQPAPQPVSQPAPQPAPQPVPQTMPQQPAPQPAQNWQPVIPQGAQNPAYGQMPPQPEPRQKPQKPQKAPKNQPAPQQVPGGFAVPGQQPGFAVPGQQPAQNSAPQMPDQKQPADAAPGEKPMTWMYLMQHYNKENAAIYKAQQDAKKNQKSEAAPKPAKAPKQGKQQAPGGFAVPGQQPPQVPGNFAVPGQQPQAPQAPGGFAVPGQQPQPQQAPGGFAVPGQQPQPQQAPGGFAVPGKQPQVPQAPGGFAVPGKQPQAPQAPGGFAVPGKQPQPQQAPGGFAVPGQQPQFQPAQPPVQQPIQPPVQQPAFNPINFGETTVLGGDDDFGATTVLSAMPEAAKPVPYLLRRKNNERILLDKPVFRIGKEKSYVDYFIADNPAISRSHANIINRDGTYYVVDTNSTNHTYVNDVMSPSNAETKLSHGDKLTLGNEEFEFKML